MQKSLKNVLSFTIAMAMKNHVINAKKLIFLFEEIEKELGSTDYIMRLLDTLLNGNTEKKEQLDIDNEDEAIYIIGLQSNVNTHSELARATTRLKTTLSLPLKQCTEIVSNLPSKKYVIPKEKADIIRNNVDIQEALSEYFLVSYPM